MLVCFDGQFLASGTVLGTCGTFETTASLAEVGCVGWALKETPTFNPCPGSLLPDALRSKSEPQAPTPKDEATPAPMSFCYGWTLLSLSVGQHEPLLPEAVSVRWSQ